MTRDAFFNELLFYMKQLPQEEAFKVATFFSDIIEDKAEDGIGEDVALRDLGNPKELAAFVLCNAYGIKPEFGDYSPEAAPVMTAPIPTAASSAGKGYTSSGDGIKNIKLLIKNLDVNVALSRDDKIHIQYEELEKSAISVKEEGGIIDFSYILGGNDGFALKSLFGGKKKEANAVVTLEIPTKYNESLTIDADNGAVKVQGIANVNMIDCVTKNDTLRILDTNATSVNAKTSNYRLTISNVNVERELKTSTNNASIDISKVYGESVECVTTGSEITLTSVDAKNLIRASTTNAHIEIKEISGSYIDLKTSNGRISGTLVGNINDYSITSKSSGGKSNLPNIPFGVKRLSAVTSKENINITFKEPVK